jgi:hypothetical protein
MLRGPSGHYAEFVRALAARSEGVFSRIEVVADPRAEAFLPSLGGAVPVAAHALPRGPAGELRAVRAALADGHRTLVLTANASHALLAETAAFVGGDALARLSLFVHWPLVKPQARLALALARRVRARSLFLAPTRGVRDALAQADCARALQVAYPATRAAGCRLRAPFRHLLMAGAARINKGLDVVAGLAERLAHDGRDLPLLVRSRRSMSTATARGRTPSSPGCSPRATRGSSPIRRRPTAASTPRASRARSCSRPTSARSSPTA